MAKILVTGSAGFIGSCVKSEFESFGHEVIGWDLVEGKDICTLKAENNSPDFICHLAAIGDIYQVNNNPVKAYESNVVLVARIMEYAKNTGAKVIHASSWECYSKALSHYIASKQAGELIVRAYHAVPSIIFRLGTAYGGNMRASAVIMRFIEKAKKGEDLEIFGTGQYRQFVHVKDIAQAFRLAVEKNSKWQGQTYNIVGNEKIYISALAEYIAGKFKVKVIKHPPREEPELIDLKSENNFGFSSQVKFWEEIDKFCGI